MKHSISQSTIEFLKSLEGKVEEEIVDYVVYQDELDRIIHKQNLLIQNLFMDKSLDLMLIVLNNKKVIKRRISDFKELEKASITELMDFKKEGEGIHWTTLDYDLSLKGFLEYELIFVDKSL